MDAIAAYMAAYANTIIAEMELDKARDAAFDTGLTIPDLRAARKLVDKSAGNGRDGSGPI